MSKRTYNPTALIRQANTSSPNIGQFSFGVDFPDDVWVLASGGGAVELQGQFPSPSTTPAPGAGKQRFRVRVRKNASGGLDPDFELRLMQNGIQQAVLATGRVITSDTGQDFSVAWDAALLGDPSGVGVGLELAQTGGNTGQQSSRRYIDINAFDWTYEDDIGAFRLVKQFPCDGRCCVAAPRWPIGDGDVIPHQGSDCEKRIVGPDGKEFRGCTLINDASQRPLPGNEFSSLKKMGTEDALAVFLDTCLLWPQNTDVGEDIADCCWVWEDDS